METVIGVVVNGREVEVLRNPNEAARPYLVEIDGVKLRYLSGVLWTFQRVEDAYRNGTSRAAAMTRGTFGTKR